MNPYASSIADPGFLGVHGVASHHDLHAAGYSGYHHQHATAYGPMLSHSDQEYQQTQSVLTDGGDHYPVAATVFDNHEELLWSGNQGGHLTSYYGVHLQKYTSFQVHAAEEVRALLPLNAPAGCILALTPSTLRCQLKRGIPMFTHSSKSVENMCALLQSPRNTVIIGGHADKLVDFDPTVPKELRVARLREEHGIGGCPILRLHPRLICSGSSRGSVRFHDPNTLEVVNAIDCHSGSLSDIDVQGDTVVTVGYHASPYGGVSADPFIKVYDARMMKALAPVPVAIDHPFLLRFLPSYSSRLLVMSSTGHAQIVDASQQNSENNSLLQVNISPGSVVETLAISPSCQCYAIGTSDGYVHLSISNETAVFHTHAEETEFGMYPYPTPVPPMGYNDVLTSLASVPFPIPVDDHDLSAGLKPPLSAWPGLTANKVYRRTPPIDPEIMKAMKIVQSIGYYPNAGSKYRPRQIPYRLKELARSTRNSNASHRTDSQVTSAAAGSEVDGDGERSLVDVPKRYRKIEVKYTKLGYEEFDYARYNKTAFSGLESLLPNAYCNAMLHVLYFVAPLRGALLSHICDREFCLACELGFLFHMLDQSGECPCQPANFLRAFRTLPEAQALSLILNDQDQAARKSANLKLLIQNWNRFVLQQIHAEVKDWDKKNIHFIDSVRQVLDGKDTGGVFSSSSSSNNNNSTTHKNERDIPKGRKDSDSKLGQSSIDDVAAASSMSSDTPKKEDVAVETTSSGIVMSDISVLFGSVQVSKNCCTVCGTVATKKNLHLSCHVTYAPKRAKPSDHAASGDDQKVTFHQILEKSLNFDQMNACWCDACKKSRPTKMTRCFESVPHIWAMNCGLNIEEDMEFFEEQFDMKNNPEPSVAGGAASYAKSVGSSGVTPCRYGANCARPSCRYSHEHAAPSGKVRDSAAGPPGAKSWIPEHFIMRWFKDGRVRILPLDPSEFQAAVHRINNCPRNEAEGVREEIVYALSAVVSHISDPAHPDKNNLVSAVNVGPSYHQRVVGSPVNQWYLFNDFCITPISREEASGFDPRWKLPAVLYYVRATAEAPARANVERLGGLTFPELTVDILRSRSLRPPSSTAVTFLPVQPEETFKKGDVVAIDAEFVTLNQEDMELRSDGTRATLKPSLLSVARISVLRGTGSMAGVPFIDDYISTQSCQVVDYLTKFSGIMPGDLDANYSSKHLTTLKNAYLKLRYLADLGVVFVGHGLKNDFRVINLTVRAEQIFDTVVLYRLPHQRMVSLRFLAWYFLDRKIQAFNHDSIEDARAALDLWRHFKEELSGKGDMEQELRKLYSVGREINWKVPGVDDD